MAVNELANDQSMDNTSGPQAIEVSGAHESESDGEGAFFWTLPRFAFERRGGKPYLFLFLGNEIEGNRLILRDAGVSRVEFDLVKGWSAYSVDIRRFGASSIDCEVSREYRAPHDSRSLGICIRELRCHADLSFHKGINRQQQNRLLNDREFHRGEICLKSWPQKLRITMETRCNIANQTPCVYCSWHEAKAEEQGAPPFDWRYLKDIDSFLQHAAQVVDCSYGEPPLTPAFQAYVERLCSNDRSLEFTSNGQTLGKKNRAALLGRSITVYVSIDAATPSTYRRYRGEGFDVVINNLRALSSEKRSQGNLPRLVTSFLVMQSNKSEIANYLRLMQELGVDSVCFRQLFKENEFEREVHQDLACEFDSAAEWIDPTELEAIAAQIHQYARQTGIETIIEWRDFPRNATASGNAPLCGEPWSSFYLLNRGIYACCYSRRPIARWQDQGGRSTADYLRDVFNGGEYREIRKELAAGRFPEHCRAALNCPIVYSSHRP